MSEHRTSIAWKRGDGPFTYETYPRTHEARFEGGVTIPVSAASDYLGDGALPNPEELLATAAASCHMLTFLAIAARRRFVVASYRDDAIAFLEPDAEKRLAVTRIELRPTIGFEGTLPTSEELTKLHEMAHRNCFIARSIRASVTVVATDPIPVVPSSV